MSRYEILRYIRKYWSPSSLTYSKTANLKLKRNMGKNVKVHKPTGIFWTQKFMGMMFNMLSKVLWSLVEF